MCVIIIRNPGIEIDPEKLTSACHVNADGYGISVIDRGKIETYKNFRTEGNDPKEVIKIFEDAKDQLVFAHLRFSTKGLKNLDNCHPFPILKAGDTEAFFMHNGTIYDFGDNSRSDSREFAEEVLSPLTEAFFNLHGDKWMEHPTFQLITEKYRPSGSVFTYYDSTGQHFSQGTGVQYEGWWASNSYSFNRTHREPTTTPSTFYNRHNAYSWNNSPGDIAKNKEMEKSPLWRLGDYWNTVRKEWGKWDGSFWNCNSELSKQDSRSDLCSTLPFVPANSTTKIEPKGKHLSVVPNENKKNKKTSSTNANTETDNTPMAKLQRECAAIGQAIHMAKNANLDPPTLTHPDKRTTFSEFADLASLEEVTMLDEEQLYEIAERWPLAATMLLMDLIFELYNKKQSERLHDLARQEGEQKQAEQMKAVNQ